MCSADSDLWRRARLLGSGAVVAAMLLGPASAQQVRLPSLFREDARVRRAVTLEPAPRTLREVFDELAEQAGLELEAAPELRDYPVALAVTRRPLHEVLETAALVTGGGWQRAARGYRMLFRGKYAPLMSRVETEADPGREKGADQPVTWTDGPAREAGEKEPAIRFHRGTFGHALLASLRQSKLDLAVQGPALMRNVNRVGGLQGLTVRGVLELLQERTGGSWQRVGSTYALVLPAEDLQALRLPERARMILRGDIGSALFKSLGPAQLDRLRQGGKIPYSEVSPHQQALFRRTAGASFASSPYFSRALLRTPQEWHFLGNSEGVHLYLGGGVNIGTWEWKYIR